MHQHTATRNGNRLVRSDDERPRTIGFPALQNDRRKEVWFDPPRSVICILDGGAVCTDCLVLCIWDGGAKLRVADGSILTEFDLLFASGPRPVRRRCKRRLVRGNVMDVEFKRTAPRYVLREPDA
jgi:hypothetical protein